MTRDQRQYSGIRWSLMGFTGIMSTLAIVMLWRSWPVAMSGAQASCGCSVTSSVSAATHGLAQLATAVALILLGTLLMGLLKSFYQQHRVQRLADRGVIRHIIHQPTGQTLRLVTDADAQAYSLGWRRPRIYITSGLLGQLSKSEITAVVRHEQAHCQARDPLMATLVQGIDQAWGWMMPWIRAWAGMATSLRELIADQTATDNYQRTHALASAMAKLMDSNPQALAAMSPNTNRVERLLNHRWQPEWRGWRWSYLTGAAGLIIGLTLLSRAQPVAAVTTPAGAGSCRQIQIICQAEIKQRQVLCANHPGRCAIPISWLPAQLTNYSPLHD